LNCVSFFFVFSKLKHTDQKQLETAYKVMFRAKMQRIKSETFNAQEHNQETSNAQAHKQETSYQTKLQEKCLTLEHFIYNQRCSQYKSDTDSLIL